MNVIYSEYFAAAAYGEGDYGTCTYDNCQTVAQSSTTGAPNTGLLQEPTFLIPAIALLAVLIVVAEVFIRKFMRKRRLARLAAN